MRVFVCALRWTAEGALQSKCVHNVKLTIQYNLNLLEIGVTYSAGSFFALVDIKVAVCVAEPVDCLLHNES